jgi:hypothetical protein
LTREKIETLISIGLLLATMLLVFWLEYRAHVAETMPAPIPISVVPTPAPVPPAKPVIAVLTVKWCEPCRRAEKQVLPLLTDLDLRKIDVDAQQALAATLFSRKSHQVPQFVACNPGPNDVLLPCDWLIGYHSADEVRAFASKPRSAPTDVQPLVIDQGVREYAAAFDTPPYLSVIQGHSPRYSLSPERCALSVLRRPCPQRVTGPFPAERKG